MVIRGGGVWDVWQCCGRVWSRLVVRDDVCVCTVPWCAVRCDLRGGAR